MDKLVINEHMDMRWHEGKPRVFIDDEPFMHCAFLVVSVDPVDPANERATVDDLATRPGARRLEGRDAMAEYGLTKGEILWGFYSSIVGWVESGYNTQVIHTNLAFPLLRQLARVGDPKAKRVLKGEIHDRLLSRSIGTVVTIIETCADVMDAEDWEIIYGMMKDTTRASLSAMVAKALSSSLQVGRFKLGSEHQPLVDELIDYANDNNDVLVAQHLAYSMQDLPPVLADRVSLHLSPGISDLARGNMATFTRLPDVLAKLAKTAVEYLDAASNRKLWSQHDASRDGNGDLHVLNEVFINRHVTAEVVDKSVRKLLKKDLSDFDKGDVATWYDLVIPVLGEALESKVATPELAEAIARSDIIKAKNLQSRELMRWLSRAPVAKHIVLPLIWVSDDVGHDLQLFIKKAGSPYYLVKDQYSNGVFAAYTTDEIVEYLAWTGLDIPHVYAGATMKARIIRAEHNEPGKYIELYGHYAKHFMAGNAAGLKAFAKEKGLKLVRLMDNGKYTSAYYTPGDAWLLNTNYVRDEWVKDKESNWLRVSPEKKEPKVGQYVLYEGESKLKSFGSYETARQYLKSIIADDPDTDPESFVIEKEESVWDPW